jgi:hypothetical protein
MIPDACTTARFSDGDLVEYYTEHTTISARVLEAVIPAAIDAAYAARDSGATINATGAHAAVAALLVLEARRVKVAA